MNLEQLELILSGNKECDKWLPLIEQYLPLYHIDTKERIAMFMAQTAHESANYTRISENLNYSSAGLLKIFPKYFNKATADLYQRQPMKIANRVYANRMGNGDEASGDGWRFRGHGLIQLTGKDNHKAFANHVSKNLDEVVKYLETKEGALHSAVWYWETNGLNVWTDALDCDGVSDIINRGRKTAKIGDAIGYAERKHNYDRIIALL